MQTLTPLSVVLVFLMGATCGGLLMAIKRHARMERIRAAFQTDLQGICDRLLTPLDEVIRITEVQESSHACASTRSAPTAETLDVDAAPEGGGADCLPAHVAAQATSAGLTSHVSG